ncbi:alpha/beta hydrolase [Aquirhabdus sp.]|uniref:alpha/beta hydrolase n=1 Tax=Aquirhabdus sp. TaxID=2824160 RepID=UPI00396CC419
MNMLLRLTPAPVYKIKGIVGRLTAALPDFVHLKIAKALGDQNLYPHLDSHLRLILSFYAKLGRGALLEKEVQESRRDFKNDMYAIAGKPTQVSSINNFSIPKPGGSLSVRHYIPELNDVDAALNPLIIFFHGGGLMVGDLDTHDEPCRLLCKYAECSVLSVNYRLAPEYPAPAAIEDGWDVLLWAHDNAAQLKINPRKIAVSGDSAGGYIAAVISQVAIQTPFAPCAQLLFYPGLDMEDTHPSRKAFSQGLFVQEKDIARARESYALASDLELDDPILSPIRGKIKGLNPVMMVTPEYDVVRSENEVYTDRLHKAGVVCHSILVEGQTHGFINFTSINRSALKATIQCAKDFGQLLREIPL